MGRGTLVFKGEGVKKKNKKSKHKADQQDEETALSNAVVETSRLAVPSIPPREESPKIKKGSGTITTSGTVVTGHQTRFTKEIRVGDALIVEVDGGQPEMRVATMRLSDLSLNLSSAFSQNLATPVPFQYIPQPRDAARDAANAQQRAAHAVAEEERHTTSGSAETGELVYRERTEHGNYRTKRVKVDGERNRSDLLELRSKKTSDKYC
jgi:hypothetical protein